MCQGTGKLPEKFPPAKAAPEVIWELQVNASEVKCIHGKMVGSVRRHKIIKHLTKYRVICQERDSVASSNRNAPSPT